MPSPPPEPNIISSVLLFVLCCAALLQILLIVFQHNSLFLYIYSTTAKIYNLLKWKWKRYIQICIYGSIRPTPHDTKNRIKAAEAWGAGPEKAKARKINKRTPQPHCFSRVPVCRERNSHARDAAVQEKRRLLTSLATTYPCSACTKPPSCSSQPRSTTDR